MDISKIIKLILGWSEVWALLIPLAVLYRKRTQPAYLKPVIIYIFIALVINLVADIIANLKHELHFPRWLMTNNYLYNIHSILRFFLLYWFFIQLRQPFLTTVKKIIPVLFLIFIIINFIFFDDFFNFYLLSSRLLATEAALLLFFCMQYYLYRLQEENPHRNDEADFWVVTGLSIYVVVSFFIFLFQNTLAIRLKDFAINIWKVHDIAYIILSVFLAKAFNIAKDGRKV